MMVRCSSFRRWSVGALKPTAILTFAGDMSSPCWQTLSLDNIQLILAALVTTKPEKDSVRVIAKRHEGTRLWKLLLQLDWALQTKSDQWQTWLVALRTFSYGWNYVGILQEYDVAPYTLESTLVRYDRERKWFPIVAQRYATTVRALSVHHSVYIENVAPRLQNFVNLEALTLDRMDLYGERDVLKGALRRLPKLRSLTWRGRGPQRALDDPDDHSPRAEDTPPEDTPLTEDTVISLLSELRHVPRLTILDLGQNDLRDAGAYGLAVALGRLPNLVTLGVADNCIGLVGLKAITTSLALGHCTNLKALYLQRNFIPPQKGADLTNSLVRLLPAVPRLQALWVQHCGLHCTHFVTIGEAATGRTTALKGMLPVRYTVERPRKHVQGVYPHFTCPTGVAPWPSNSSPSPEY